MRRAHYVLLGAALALSVACRGGPKGESQGAKTPQDMLEEQLRLAEESEKSAAARGDTTEEVETDLEKKRKFDKVQAKRELLRAARNAAQCPSVVDEEGPGGSATVRLTFDPAGHVTDAEIGSEFTDTRLGKCILRAMKAIIVPTYDGGPVSVDHEIKLESAEEEDDDDDKKKKK